MAEVIFILVFSIPAILGLAEILHTVKLLLVYPKRKGNKILVIVPDDENFVKQIMNVAEQGRWHGSHYAEKIVVLDTLLSEENKKECALLARKLNLEVCSKAELTEKFF